jgi:hypothetical protein
LPVTATSETHSSPFGSSAPSPRRQPHKPPDNFSLSSSDSHPDLFGNYISRSIG